VFCTSKIGSAHFRLLGSEALIVEPGGERRSHPERMSNSQDLRASAKASRSENLEQRFLWRFLGVIRACHFAAQNCRLSHEQWFISTESGSRDWGGGLSKLSLCFPRNPVALFDLAHYRPDFYLAGKSPAGVEHEHPSECPHRKPAEQVERDA
jgi:hypothetical protein